MSLRNKAISASRWKMISSVIRAVLQILQVVILTKILDKTDYGLMAICMMITGLSRPLIDLGIEAAIIYKQDSTKSQLSTLFWLKIIMASILVITFFFVSPLIANFYDEAELTQLLRITSISFILTAIRTQFSSLLARELKFEAFGKAEIIAQIISLVVSYILAINGFGVYSLLLSFLGLNLFQALAFAWLARKIHRPVLMFNLGEIKEYIRFGVYQIPNSLVNNLGQQIDIMLIGKFMGTDTLGLYSLARTLIYKPSLLLLPAISNVAFPLFSKLKEQNLLRNATVKVFNISNSALVPVFVAIAVLSEPIVLLIYGEKWIDITPYVSLLSWYTVFRIMKMLAYPLLASRGKVKEALYWISATSILTILSVLIGTSYSIETIVMILIGLEILLLVFYYSKVMKPNINIELSVYMREIARPLIFSLGFILFNLLWSQFIDSPFWMIFTVGISGSISYLLLSYGFNPLFFHTILDFLKLRITPKTAVEK